MPSGGTSLGSLTPVLLLALAASPSGTSSEPPFDPNVVLRVSIASDEREFHIGETIPIQLSFSSAVKDRYQVNMAQYDRSGRMEYERFRVSPENGAVDPLANRPGGVGGGITGYKFLSAEPWAVTLSVYLPGLSSGKLKFPSSLVVAELAMLVSTFRTSNLAT